MTSITDARQQANQANAQLSTGPRTEAGKAASSQNARKHGLCAKDLTIAPGEQEEFDELLQSHLAQLQPDNVIEHTLFDELVAATWNLRRIRRMEAELCRDIDPLAALDDDKLQNKLDRLARHQARFERSLYRATKELKALQTERSHRKILANTQHTPTMSPFVSSIVLTNQTRVNSLAAVRQIRDQEKEQKNEYQRQLALGIERARAEAEAAGLR